MNLDRLCELTGAATAIREARLQTLWSGYGDVVRYRLDGERTVIVKHVRPPEGAHPRKIRSYEVERAWYSGWSERCTDACRVPTCLGTWSDGHETVFVLEDLDAAGFPLRKRYLSDAEIAACLSWLAHFHATFLHAQPTDLWENGTYWHLATRPDELAAMRDLDLKRRAPELDHRLNQATYQTLVHGDAKTANFCFALDGSGVSAVDFQYVGGGCGMKDVAYFLGGCLSASEASRATSRWLGVYFDHLRTALGATRAREAIAIEREWRGLYEVAVLDFERFLDGWR